jgi:hypothetical protein
VGSAAFDVADADDEEDDEELDDEESDSVAYAVAANRAGKRVRSLMMASF